MLAMSCLEGHKLGTVLVALGCSNKSVRLRFCEQCGQLYMTPCGLFGPLCSSGAETLKHRLHTASVRGVRQTRVRTRRGAGERWGGPAGAVAVAAEAAAAPAACRVRIFVCTAEQS